ncbi:plac8 onzin related protein 3 isoform X2 [Pseudorasbora parva]|uniref:plac8 onzin related protein 3 isoform X1 n=2 Tax=Pseudorasbora parva TaxID=51549 RepID=UPI00351F3A25
MIAVDVGSSGSASLDGLIKTISQYVSRQQNCLKPSHQRSFLLFITVPTVSLPRAQIIMATKMVIQQPRPLVLAPGSNQWSTGICECDHLQDCCFAFWCSSCFACITAQDHGECLCLPLLDSFGLIPPITMAMRVSVRRTYGIEDSICNDCVLSFCCGPCSYCQIRRELKSRNHPVTLLSCRK